MDGKLAILVLVSAIVGVVLILLRERQKRHRPLSKMAGEAPGKAELGMEATDLGSVQSILDRNDALARKTGVGGAQVSWTEVGAASGQRHQGDRS